MKKAKKFIIPLLVVVLFSWNLPAKKAEAAVIAAPVVGGGAIAAFAGIMITLGLTVQFVESADDVTAVVSDAFEKFKTFAESTYTGAASYIEGAFNDYAKTGRVPIRELSRGVDIFAGATMLGVMVKFIRDVMLPEIRGPVASFAPGSAFVVPALSGIVLDASQVSSVPSLAGFPSSYAFPFQKPSNAVFEAAGVIDAGAYHGYYFAPYSDAYLSLTPFKVSDGSLVGLDIMQGLSVAKAPNSVTSFSSVGFMDSSLSGSTFINRARNFNIGADIRTGVHRFAISFDKIPVSLALTSASFLYLGLEAATTLGELGISKAYWIRYPDGKEALSLSGNPYDAGSIIKEVVNFSSLLLGAVATSTTWNVLGNSWADVDGANVPDVLGNGAEFDETGQKTEEGNIDIPYVPSIPGIRTTEDAKRVTGAVPFPAGATAETKDFAGANTAEKTITDINEYKDNEIKFSLWNVFPFCIPFDLVDLIRVFVAPPETPVFNTVWKIPYIGDFPISIDLSPMNGLAAIVRNLEKAAFIAFLIYITRGIIKG